jgi:taurine dioxygenase
MQLMASAQSQAATRVLRLRAATAHLGAELDAADLAALLASRDIDAGEALRTALDQYLVLRVKGAWLERRQVVELAELFGTVLTDRKKTGDEEYESVPLSDFPQLKMLSNARDQAGRLVGDKGAEPQIWHCDGSHRDAPNAYTLLYAEKAPPNPPCTSYMSAYALYDGLPGTLKTQVAGLRAIHSPHNRSQGFWSFMEGPSVDVALRAEGPRHPLVCLHPRTRRPYLHLPRRRDALVVGMNPEQSRRLMERLWAAVFASEAIWPIALEAGDLLIADNRPTMHARDGWDAVDARVVLNVSMSPEIPLAMVPA